MLQQFNTNTIKSKFIKALLKSNYIPTVQIWKPGISLTKDFIYITKDYILKALKDFDNLSTGPQDPLNQEYFKIIDNYVPGKWYKGITTNYISNNSLYDTETHFYLGEYLRAYRDLYNIDLMPYYNCWNGQMSDRIKIKYNYDENNILNYTLDKNNIKKDAFKTILVPIRFNQKYTIFIDSNYPIALTYGYCENDQLITEYKDENTAKAPLKIIDRISFNQPYLFNSIKPIDGQINTNNNITYKRNYISLIIQLPENNSSNIVVLEGDYTKQDINSYYYSNKLITKFNLNKLINNTNKEFNIVNGITKYIIPDKTNQETIDEHNKKINTTLKSSGLSLIHTCTDNNYAFSDRLIEYLLLNVICNTESISNNILNLESYITSDKFKFLNNIKYNDLTDPGVWKLSLQKFIFDTVTNYNNINHTCIDINGDLDKDSEYIMMRGKE